MSENSYPIRTLSQLPLLLKGFRKEKRLTQAAMGEKLGITQQSYAAFEANPAVATFDRLFAVLRLLDVDISLDQVVCTSDASTVPSKAVGSVAAARPSRVVSPTGKKESW